MADHAVEDDIYVYRGGRAPQHIMRARIDESVEEIDEAAFSYRRTLVHVETHNRIRKIGVGSFIDCKLLPRIDIRSVVEIADHGFHGCEWLHFIEFGDKLESIGKYAFYRCPIMHLKLPSVVSVDTRAFNSCERLRDVEFSEKLERVGSSAFDFCRRLQRIAIPLKRGLFSDHNVFYDCEQLTRVDLVGGCHQSAASLHMESWRAEMKTEIDIINLLLPDTAAIEKASTIRGWMDSVINKLDYYKAEHSGYVKEAATLLELALWKAKLDEKEDDCCEEKGTKKIMIDSDDARKDRRVTCGADTVIKNVIPFLQFLE